MNIKVLILYFGTEFVFLGFSSKIGIQESKIGKYRVTYFDAFGRIERTERHGNKYRSNLSISTVSEIEEID